MLLDLDLIKLTLEKTVAGYSTPSDSVATVTAPLGVPIGLEFLGQPWRDSELLDLAERFEEVLQARNDPEEILRAAVAAVAGGSSGSGSAV
jgi:hypothetical protein